ncbi:hypothetical protein KBZ21_55730, partial [Streptomyces sp. A73]|nr:hypothetical protein [Streptomyces sp. A73]
LLRPTGIPLRRRQLPLRVLHRPDGGQLPLRSLSSHIRRGLLRLPHLRLGLCDLPGAVPLGRDELLLGG